MHQRGQFRRHGQVMKPVYALPIAAGYVPVS
eukprot:SAG31_NODE_31896_length_362_cov_1.376426_1_plen_30_part_01